MCAGHGQSHIPWVLERVGGLGRSKNARAGHALLLGHQEGGREMRRSPRSCLLLGLGGLGTCCLILFNWSS